LGEHYFKNDASNKALLDSLQAAIDARDRNKYMFYDDSIKRMSNEFVNFEKYSIPDEHREVYKSIGGTPFLDQNYTVFGEVIEGLAVVDSIAAVQTGPNNRPIKDVRILSVRVLD
jgi:peptidyl-prolyl cis-trans isomerase B (cyclophilin B)